MNDRFIIEPFNGPFFMLFACSALVYIVLHIAFRKASLKKRSAAISVVMVLTTIGFIAYKLALSRDEQYSAALFEAGLLQFNWWNELPLQLCNINMLMIPFGLILGSRKLQGFSVYSGTLGALMAILMPAVGFTGVSVFTPRILGFYLTHWMIFFAALSILTLGIFKPKYREIPSLLLTFFIICTIIFGINMLLRYSGLSLTANYWFNVMTEGNPLLELFYSLIPVPLLYTAPALLILAAYMLIVTSVSKMIDRNKASRVPSE